MSRFGDMRVITRTVGDIGARNGAMGMGTARVRKTGLCSVDIFGENDDVLGPPEIGQSLTQPRVRSRELLSSLRNLLILRMSGYPSRTYSQGLANYNGGR